MSRFSAASRAPRDRVGRACRSGFGVFSLPALREAQERWGSETSAKCQAQEDGEYAGQADDNAC